MVNIQADRALEHTAVRSGLVAVEDDGPGIPEADAPHIFDRFYRADKSRSHSSGHFGLGLAVAKSIVEKHAGTLDFANNPDRGVTFRMRLPR